MKCFVIYVIAVFVNYFLTKVILLKINKSKKTWDVADFTMTFILSLIPGTFLPILLLSLIYRSERIADSRRKPE